MAEDDPALMLLDVDDGHDRPAADLADGNPAIEGSEWHPDLLEALYRILYLSDTNQSQLDSELRKLEPTYRSVVYSELIYLLSHLRFPPEEAKGFWQCIVEHRDVMERRLGASVDIRVALVSYFVQVNRKLRNPKIIELKLFEQTRASAYTDELTGLRNYRFFLECLAREIGRCERSNAPLSLVMVDIDNFKFYNDQNGHEAGNQVLAAVARLLAGSVRNVDIAARYGGEEFALILPMTPKIDARLVAERARQQIGRHAFAHMSTQPGGKLTVSMGIASYPADAREVGELVRRADRAMYAAKTGGKDRVHLYGQNIRSHPRTSTSIGGQFRRLAAESHSLTALNISERGLLFLSDVGAPRGSLIEISLLLPASGQEITASGRVVRVQQKENGKFEVGIRIVDISRKDRILLAGYIRGATRALPAGDPEAWLE